MRRLGVLAWLLGLGSMGVPSALEAVARPADEAQSVTGTASVDLRDHTGADVQYHVAIKAFQDPEDGFQGTVVSRITRAESGSAIVMSKVSCVEISGNSAWIESVVTLSTNETLFAVGDVVLTYVRDFGETGDVLHQELVRNLPAVVFDANGDGVVDCTDRPALLPSVVVSGNLTIK